MLRCTIEIIPQGDESRTHQIGIVEIANDGTGTSSLGNYCVLLKKTPPWSGALIQKWRGGEFQGSPEDHEIMMGEVYGFDRVKRGPYDLLFRALKACGLDKRN